jgi:hypothetical protein
MACFSWLDFTRRNQSGDDVPIDQPAVPGRYTASLHFVSKPFVVIDGAGQEIQARPGQLSVPFLPASRFSFAASSGGTCSCTALS